MISGAATKQCCVHMPDVRCHCELPDCRSGHLPRIGNTTAQNCLFSQDSYGCSRTVPHQCCSKRTAAAVPQQGSRRRVLAAHRSKTLELGLDDWRDDWLHRGCSVVGDAEALQGGGAGAAGAHLLPLHSPQCLVQRGADDSWCWGFIRQKWRHFCFLQIGQHGLLRAQMSN